MVSAHHHNDKEAPSHSKARAADGGPPHVLPMAAIFGLLGQGPWADSGAKTLPGRLWRALVRIISP